MSRLGYTVHLICCGSPLLVAASPARVIQESKRAMPVAYNVDVAIVGGSTWAVAAAVAATKTGASVFLAAPRPYLGEDLCATLRLRLEAGETPQT